MAHATAEAPSWVVFLGQMYPPATPSPNGELDRFDPEKVGPRPTVGCASRLSACATRFT